MSHFFSFFARKSTKNYMDAPLHHISFKNVASQWFILQFLYVHLCCCLNYWSQSNHLLFWSYSLVWHLRLFLGWCCFVQKCFCCCHCCFFSSVDNCPVEAISLKSSHVGERKYLLLQSKSIIIKIIIIIALERWCCNGDIDNFDNHDHE